MNCTHSTVQPVMGPTFGEECRRACWTVYGNSVMAGGYVTRNIRDGIPNLGMPSFEKTLTPDEIKSIVDYLYEAEAAAGAKKPDLPAMIETMDYEIQTDVWADNLSIPWAIVFLNEDSALVTERPGTLRMIIDGKLAAEPVSGTPEVLHEGQGGLMDVNIYVVVNQPDRVIKLSPMGER